MTFAWVTREEAELPLGVASRCVVGVVTLETRISQTRFQPYICGAYDHAPEWRISSWRYGDIRQAENACERWALGQVEQIPLLERLGFEVCAVDAECYHVHRRELVEQFTKLLTLRIGGRDD